ncbi:hypothetical protein J1N35_018479 [Gossypium stocksii]|uniref:Uncharacterized protein n=1 Tax=Gossypium stocksii TaxID=47602 RepID=A0A9D4A529_9ROSI|nr:hypothetical protein J1N35_018479 [Gossypium stocksii]
MSRRIKVTIYYDDQICDTRIGVIFVSAKSIELTFNKSIKINELLSRIRWKVLTSSQRRILSLKYRYLTSMNIVRYDTFQLKSNMDVEAMLDKHCSSGNIILKLYAQFVNVKGRWSKFDNNSS